MNSQELRIKGYSEITRTSEGFLTAKKRNQIYFSRDGQIWKKLNKLEAKKMAETTEAETTESEKVDESEKKE